LKPILIHTHFHNRKTGVTRSIENVLPFFDAYFETYVYGKTIDGAKITTLQFLKFAFSKRKVTVHCHRNNEILRMLLFRFLGAKFKLIASRHSATKPSKLTLFLLKKAAKVVTLIKSMSDDLRIENTLIAHGINVQDFVPNSNGTLPKISQENIILNTGRIRKSKGQLTLLKAANVLKGHENWCLVFVGKVDKPAFLVELKNLAKELYIENQVYFFDEIREIIPYYQAAKIFVAPSFSEGFSLVTAEAMACECNVIASKNVGVHNDLITHQKNGYLFEAGNSDELASILQKIISGELPFLGKEARNEIIKNWSAEKESSALMKMYQ
jgi:mannosyltransferase